MMGSKAAKDGLNEQAQTLEQLQEKVREIVKLTYLRGIPLYIAREKLKKEIGDGTSKIRIPELKEAARRSLWAFANSQLLLWSTLPAEPHVIIILGTAAGNDFSDGAWRRKIDKIAPRIVDVIGTFGTYSSALPESVRLTYRTRDFGQPLNQYYRDVWEKQIKPTIDRIADEVAIDPDDLTGRNSLRNRAEMEVRYAGHTQNIEELKARGVRLAVCSAHQDCSDRCAPWQGRIYSLDGSTGTIDGHTYVPIEIPTESPEVWYTTRAGKRYRNGLFGFNCRHYLEEYKGAMLPVVSAEKRKKEYAITQEQRRMERAVRHAKAMQSTWRGINDEEARKYRKIASRAYAEYQAYSEAHGRAYYPDRVKI